MPPIWFCLDCEGIAYGWARGACIHCGSPRVVATDCLAESEGSAPKYRLLFLSNREWTHLEAVAILAGRSPRDLLAEREQMEVVLIREEAGGHGCLVLLKTAPNGEGLTNRASESTEETWVLIR
jgi:hypothetical protein